MALACHPEVEQRALRQLSVRLVDGGERRLQQRRLGDVVETHYGEVAGDPPPQPGRLPHHAGGEHVRGCHHSRGRLCPTEKRLSRLTPALAGGRGRKDVVGRHGKAELRCSISERDFSSAHSGEPGSPDIGNPLVTETDQVCERLLDAGRVVGTHAGERQAGSCMQECQARQVRTGGVQQDRALVRELPDEQDPVEEPGPHQADQAGKGVGPIGGIGDEHVEAVVRRGVRQLGAELPDRRSSEIAQDHPEQARRRTSKTLRQRIGSVVELACGL